MSITKQTVIDQITVSENKTIFYRTATRIFEDDKKISETYHRTTLTPESDLTNEPAEVVAIANAIWSPEYIAEYKIYIANERSKTPVF